MLAQRLTLEAELCLFQGRDEPAGAKFVQALKVAERIEDYGLMGHLYWKQCVWSAFRNDEGAAIKQFQKAIEMHVTHGFLAEIPKIRAQWDLIRKTKGWNI